jgi:hypothetical protein
MSAQLCQAHTGPTGNGPQCKRKATVGPYCAQHAKLAKLRGPRQPLQPRQHREHESRGLPMTDESITTLCDQLVLMGDYETLSALVRTDKRHWNLCQQRLKNAQIHHPSVKLFDMLHADRQIRVLERMGQEEGKVYLTSHPNSFMIELYYRYGRDQPVHRYLFGQDNEVGAKHLSYVMDNFRSLGEINTRPSI